MRHQLAGRKLGRTTSHRWALFRNMASSLVTHERIETTLPKAKELRGFADYLITLGKQNDLAARRRAFDFVRSQSVVQKLFGQLAPRFQDRAGGYTRIYQLGHRLGDGASMAMIEYLPGAPMAKTESDAKKSKKKY